MSIVPAALALLLADPLAPLPDPPARIVLVHRGESVTLRIAAGPLTISTPARALHDAGPGERVRVTIPATRRTLEADVYGPGLVILATP